MELFEHLRLETEFEYGIPAEHKEIVRERIRIANENPDQLLDWNKVKEF